MAAVGDARGRAARTPFPPAVDCDWLHGINPAFEVLRAGRRQVHEAWMQDHLGHPRLARLAEALEARKVPLHRVERGRLTDLCRTPDHQGVVLRSSPYPYAEADAALSAPRVLLLDNVEDPHNVGACLRSAESFGFGSVLLPHKGVPPVTPTVVRTSAGASEHLAIVRDRSANAYLKLARAQGFTVAALDGQGKQGLEELAALALPRILLVLGGEDRAVGQFILMQADHVVRLPQGGRINSLNASVAAGIAMHALRARSDHGMASL